MSDVFEGDPVTCNISLVGSKYEAATKAEFVFYKKEDDSEVGREEAELSGGNGMCQWIAPNVEPEDKLNFEVYYAVEFEVDGAQECAAGFGEDITIWTRQVKITAKDPDGNAMKDAKLEVMQGEVCDSSTSTVRKTDSQGTFTFDLREPASVLVQFLAPYNLLEWTKGNEETGRVRECKVEKKPYKAQIWSHPASEDEVRHYVNLAENADEPHHGHLLKLRVGAEGDNGKTEGLTAQAGDEIHYQIKISEYKRSDPAVGVKVNGVTKAATGTREWKDKVALREDGSKYKPTEIDIELGYEGGISVEIKVGATPDCADQTLKIVTWRRLFYELMAPNMLVPKLDANGTLADGSTGTDITAAIRTKVTERLAPVFVEYLCYKSHIYPDASATAGTIMPATYFGLTGDDLHVLSAAAAMQEPVAFDGGMGNKEIKVRAADKCYYNRTTDIKSNAPTVNATSAIVRASSPYKYVFRYSMANGADGTIDVTDCEWEAHIEDTSPYRQDDGTYDHPGLNADGTPKSGAVSLSWFRYKDHQNVEIVLPETAAPGNLVGGISATKCPIVIEFKIQEAGAYNGLAWSGRQILCLRTSAAGSCSSTVCHELGHSMGMTIMAGKSKIPPGMPAAKHVDNGGVYYVNGTPVGNGKRACHLGPHCATGVADVSQDTFSDGSCIMFGAGGAADSRPSFCDVCVPYVKARRLTDILTSWASRADDEY